MFQFADPVQMIPGVRKAGGSLFKFGLYEFVEHVVPDHKGKIALQHIRRLFVIYGTPIAVPLRALQKFAKFEIKAVPKVCNFGYETFDLLGLVVQIV